MKTKQLTSRELQTKLAEAIEEWVDDRDLLGGMIQEQAQADSISAWCSSEADGTHAVHVHLAGRDGKKRILKIAVTVEDA